MTNRTAASRYARALFDVVLSEKSDLQQVETELAGFVDLFRKHPELQKVLLNPAVPSPRKRAAVAALGTSARLPPVLFKLVVLLAERDRLVILPDLLAAYRARLLNYRNVVRAEVVTAAPLAAARVAQIERGLAAATGRTVTLETRVDPTLVGGLVARVNGTVYDASITRQLQRLREQLERRT